MTQIKVRIPLAQYSYMEYDFEGTPEEAIYEINYQIKNYNTSLEAHNTPGLTPKDWQRCLDTYLITNGITEEDLTTMSDRQRLLINEIKKSLSRIKNKSEDGMRANNINRTIIRD